MAYYLDSSFDLGTYQPSSVLDDEATVFLAPTDFDLDSTIFSDPGPIPSRTTGPAGLGLSSANNYTHYPALQDRNLAGPSGGSHGLGASTSSSSNAFPLLDPGSPFNSTETPYPVRSLTRDGRLKTKLMGVGHDGGFLTSPIIVGKPRVDSRTGRVRAPEISIDSPIVPMDMAPQSSLMTPGNSSLGSVCARTESTASDMTPSLSGASSSAFMTISEQSSSTLLSAAAGSAAAATAKVVSSEPTGLGMGIIGMPDLQLEVPYNDEAAALRSFGMVRAPTTGQSGCPTATSTCDSTPRHQRSVTHNGPPPRFIEYGELPHSPPPVLAAAPTRLRPTRALPTRTINKAKSCSALSISARQQARRDSNAYEPLTPTSAYQSTFPPGSMAPYSQDIAVSHVSNNGPLSFADLYNLDGSAQFDDEKAKQDSLDLVVADEDGVIGLYGTDGLAVGMSGLLPQRYGPPSAASSPSTPYLSDPSPDHGHHYQSMDDAASTAMLAASSVESNFSSQGAPAAGRQRAMYPPTHGQYEGASEHFDPHMHSAQVHPSRQRQLSASAAYGHGPRNFSYPTRYAAPPPQFETVQWDRSSSGLSHLAPPPGLPVPSTPRHRPHPNPHHYRAHTGPAATRIVDYSVGPPPPMPQSMFVPNNLQDEYDRKMAQFDSLYDPAARMPHRDDYPHHQEHLIYHQEQVPPVSSKRGRDDDYYDSMEPVPTSPELDEAGSRQKRLRTVASAPCLPSRRLRPGPRPKGSKSPAEQHQSVFSATLSPPVPQIRRATSPFSSPLLSDDEGGRFPDRDANGNPATAATITYVPGPPALPGQPRSSVPRDVLQSLYSGIPSHTAPNGVKVSKRYVCLIEGCDRSFPRKSAIESHIQTHLEDKPFVCPHDDCGASFVRQHDLRRHERIHSGNKPFPCPCGKGFARGDALARHRARGICSGAVALGK